MSVGRAILAILTCAWVVVALYAAAQMLNIDLFQLQPLSTNLQERPDAQLGNVYARWTGWLLFGVGSALLCYKWALGFDGIDKKTYGISTVTGD